MISQKATFHPDFSIKSFTEYNNNQIIFTEEYDLFGNITYFENSAGWVRKTFNEIGKLIKEENSVSGKTLIVEYYRNGYGNEKQTKTTDKNGNWYIVEYNKNGDIIRSYDSFGTEKNF